ncbi:Gfo/Idh/MocA family protein [Rhizobium ruizarguesonis]|uniref:Gfo/Idh/MocA family protein n=1 Tax=Rhizobium ruizarguesonis TaxID=2081791 RepID=UPI0010306679|nr:Gfo/Idh/MocA family oxidoreductase [Rhizobium ruizarguesonis]TBA11989.1 Gfo/Idh/MocA family oxidoreductase [Rhizobium ruizarguesonis]
MVGAGTISRYYGASLRKSPNLTLAAVADLNLERTKSYANEGITVYRDYRTLLEKAGVDAVIINLPNDIHFEACFAALNAGKHVCCEKPLTIHLDQALALAETASKANLTLFTAFHRRYNRPVLELQRAVQARRHPIRHIQISYRENIRDHVGGDGWYLDPVRCGGGCIADNGPNAFDTLAMFVPNYSVTQADIVFNADDIDRRATIWLENPDGVTASVVLDWDYRNGEDKAVKISFDDGTVLAADMLAGFPAFKSSLFHEYDGVLADFSKSVRAGVGRGEQGINCVRLVTQSYSNMGGRNRSPSTWSSKTDV